MFRNSGEIFKRHRERFQSETNSYHGTSWSFDAPWRSLSLVLLCAVIVLASDQRTSKDALLNINLWKSRDRRTGSSYHQTSSACEILECTRIAEFYRGSLSFRYCNVYAKIRTIFHIETAVSEIVIAPFGMGIMVV